MAELSTMESTRLDSAPSSPPAPTVKPGRKSTWSRFRGFILAMLVLATWGRWGTLLVAFRERGGEGSKAVGRPAGSAGIQLSPRCKSSSPGEAGWSG